MVNSLDLTVQFTYRTHFVHIEPDQMRMHIIQTLICDYFHIDINEFSIEIYDERFESFIILDEHYLNDLRYDPYFTTNNSLKARVFPKSQSRFNAQFNNNVWPTLNPDESRYFLKFVLREVTGIVEGGSYYLE